MAAGQWRRGQHAARRSSDVWCQKSPSRRCRRHGRGRRCGSSGQADGFFWDRLHNQQVRIHEGVQKGSLTRGEAARLEAQERQLRRLHGRLEDRGDGLSDRDATGCGTRSTSRATGSTTSARTTSSDANGRRPRPWAALQLERALVAARPRLTTGNLSPAHIFLEQNVTWLPEQDILSSGRSARTTLS